LKLIKITQRKSYKTLTELTLKVTKLKSKSLRKKILVLVAVEVEATEVVMHQEVVDVSEEILNQKATVAEAAVVILVVAEAADFHQEKVVEISKAVATSKVVVTSNVEDLTNQVETELEKVQVETIVNLTVVEAMEGERNIEN
jgi:hypothetical protein